MRDAPDQSAVTGPCPICGRKTFAAFSRVEHDDGSVIVYFRCSTCSHVRVDDAARTDPQR